MDQYVIKKRIKSMSVRILANIEHVLGMDDLESIGPDEEITITGGDLQIIRSEILNAGGDTTRSLIHMEDQPSKGTLSLSRDQIAVINDAKVDILEKDDVPVFRMVGNFNLLSKIRNEVGAGLVYNKTYTCAGMDDTINALLPFLDSVKVTGIKIAGGEYKEWRDAVCEMYLEGLGNE